MSSLILVLLESIPAYIIPAYQWLLDNLHNPYPSKETKKTISQQTKCSSKDIDSWFADTRKRIGWNALRKSRFGNKQERIIAAATSIFKPKLRSFTDDLNQSLISEMNPNDAYRADFMLIMRKARSLYAHKFPDLFLSNLEGEKYSTPEKPRHTFDDSASAYPTPEPSPPSFPSPEADSPTPSSLSPSSEPTSRKRRQASLDDQDCVHPEIMVRPAKRFRYFSCYITLDRTEFSLSFQINC